MVQTIEDWKTLAREETPPPPAETGKRNKQRACFTVISSNQNAYLSIDSSLRSTTMDNRANDP